MAMPTLAVRLKSIALAPRSRLQQVAIGVVLATCFTALRWQVDGGALGLHFVSCFPAVLLASLLLEPVFVPAVALGSIAFAQWLLADRWWVSPPDLQHAVVASFFLAAIAVLALAGIGLRAALVHADRLLVRQDALNAALRQRACGSFALAAALLDRTPADSVDGLRENLGARFAALAVACGRLQSREFAGARARATRVAESALRPLAGRDRVTLAGPDCALDDEIAIALTLVLYELAAQSARTGALAQAGKVDLRWQQAASGRLPLVWQERDAAQPALQDRADFLRALATVPGVVSVGEYANASGLRWEIEVVGFLAGREDKSPAAPRLPAKSVAIGPRPVLVDA